MVAFTFFDKYLIALDTYFSWVPTWKTLGYLKFIQIAKCLIMQSGPFFAGYLLSLTPHHKISLYYKVLAAINLVLLLCFHLAFNNVDEEVQIRKRKSLLIREEPERQSLVDSVGPRDADKSMVNKIILPRDVKEELLTAREAHDHPKNQTVLAQPVHVTSDEPPTNRAELVKEGYEKPKEIEQHDHVIRTNQEDNKAIEQSPEARRSVASQAYTSTESEQRSIFYIVSLVWNDLAARHIIIIGLYLRIAKKYVDFGFHLWAEISRKENGLGLSKLQLGTFSTAGGITSVVLFYIIFFQDKVESLPYLIRRSLIILTFTIAAFPFLILTTGATLNFLIFLSILSFMINESILFTAWVGLVNTCLPKTVRGRVYSLSLALKGIIGFTCTIFIFEGFRHSLESPTLTYYIGPLNSTIFFWGFALLTVIMCIVYRRLAVVEDEDEEGKFYLTF